MKNEKMPLEVQVITITDMNSPKDLRELSKRAFIGLQQSNEQVGNKFELKTFSATYAQQVPAQMAQYNLRWNYPWEGSQTDLTTGLKKSAYPTKNRNNRIAGAISH